MSNNFSNFAKRVFCFKNGLKIYLFHFYKGKNHSKKRLKKKTDINF